MKGTDLRRSRSGRSAWSGALVAVAMVVAGAVSATPAAAADSLDVVAWGWNIAGQSQVPDELTGVTAIAAGGTHSLALKSDGTVVAWGNNLYGESTVPADLTGVTAISASGFHSLALKSDGTVVAWGSNVAGEGIVPPGLRGRHAQRGAHGRRHRGGLGQ